MITHLNEKLIAVEVPSDATEIQTWNHGIGFKTKIIDRKPDDTNGFYHTETGLFRWKNWKIIGEVDANTISFDVEPYLEYDKYLNKPINYIQTDMVFKDKNKSFRSLLQSKGLYFENPIKKPNGEHYYYDNKVSFDEIETLWDGGSYNEDLEKWQESENKVIKGKLIILENV